MEAKIVDRYSAAEIAKNARRHGKVIGFTSGIFDLLHAGHVDYLETARSLVDLLFVGVNSDNSARARKGEKRPINPLPHRLGALAGLSSVDYLFSFDEHNTAACIDILRPDRYIKGGDYTEAALTSAPLVRAYGGAVDIIPLRFNSSTTSIIERVVQRYNTPVLALDEPTLESRPAIFLDRDGTIIEQIEYLHQPERVRLLPGAAEGIKMLRQAGYRIVIVTNQPGIGLGLISIDQFFAVNKAMLAALRADDALIDRIYFCPHSDAEGCSCRKPSTALPFRAAAAMNIRITDSIVAGDMTSDIEMARRLGCRSLLLRSGRAGADRRYVVKADLVADSLADGGREILQSNCRSGVGELGGPKAFAAEDMTNTAFGMTPLM